MGGTGCGGIRVFSNQSTLCMRWPKYWSLIFNISPSNEQTGSPLGWTGGISTQSKGLLRAFSNTTAQKHQFFGARLSVQSNSHIHTGEGSSKPVQYFRMENPMDGGAWQAVVYGVGKSQTQLSEFTFTFMLWRRNWQPTPVFLPGESQGRGSLVGCHLSGRIESDRAKATQQQQQTTGKPQPRLDGPLLTK